mmetsp:Transcript_47029/g.105998  ORF Transcript_47029/g.105998 Transcript_47029/m.105998 type:complete len:247 (-) Transcript_47029:55-795(-)
MACVGQRTPCTIACTLACAFTVQYNIRAPCGGMLHSVHVCITPITHFDFPSLPHHWHTWTTPVFSTPARCSLIDPRLRGRRQCTCAHSAHASAVRVSYHVAHAAHGTELREHSRRRLPLRCARILVCVLILQGQLLARSLAQSQGIGVLVLSVVHIHGSSSKSNKGQQHSQRDACHQSTVASGCSSCCRRGCCGWRLEWHHWRRWWQIHGHGCGRSCRKGLNRAHAHSDAVQASKQRFGAESIGEQ